MSDWHVNEMTLRPRLIERDAVAGGSERRLQHHRIADARVGEAALARAEPPPAPCQAVERGLGPSPSPVRLPLRIMTSMCAA
jgi:hypothetical protein